MAVLVAIGGAGIGALFGAPTLGFQIGSILGNMLFPAQGPSTVGPRLQDLTVQSSALGAAIAWGDGTVRIAGNIFWSTGIKEHQNVEEVSTKGGIMGGGATSTTFTYDVSFAEGLAEGPADAVLRIWADQKLIYDKTNANFAKMDGLRFRFYKGTEDQLPDPLIEADPNVGAGMCPAFRGLSYIVFENLPLGPFGNHIPNITVELAFSAISSIPTKYWTRLATGNGVSNEPAVDYDRGLWYAGGADASAADTLFISGYDDMIERRRIKSVDTTSDSYHVSFASGTGVGPDGLLYGKDGGSNQSAIFCIDPATGREVSRFGTQGSGFPGFTPTACSYPGRIGFVSAYDQASGTRIDFVVCPTYLGGQVGILKCGTLAYVDGFDMPSGSRGQRVFGRRAGAGFGEVYVTLEDGTVYKFRVASDARYIPTAGSIPAQSVGVAYTTPDQVLASDLDATAATYDAGGVEWIGYDASDDSLLGWASTSDGLALNWLFKWREDVGVVWATATAAGAPAHGNNRLGSGSFAMQSATTVYQYDTTTGALSSTSTVVDTDGIQVYDGTADSILHAFGGNQYLREYLNRGSGLATTVEAWIQKVCGKVDLDPADLDTSAFSATPLDGILIGRPVAGKDALLPVGQAFFFDACESDYLIKFVARGASSIATITENELGIANEETGEVVLEKRTADLELPASCTVTFIDLSKDYQQNSKTRSRTRAPKKAMSSAGSLSIALPIVMEPDDGMQIAEKTLYSAWLERAGYTMIWPWSYVWIDPTDIATISLNDGTSFDLRAIKASLGLDYSIAAEGVSQDAIGYTSTAAAGLEPFIPQTIRTAGYTELLVLDVPLLRDGDDRAGVASVVYYLASSYSNPNWPGCAIYRSVDGSNYGSPIGTDVTPATWGACVSALPDNLDPWTWDNATSLVVSLNEEIVTMTSADDLTVLAGANAAAVIRTDGAAEIIQFANAVHNADGTWTLSRLLRGRRGTDVFCGSHAAGDRFILLNPADIELAVVSPSDRGLLRYWKGVGFGTLVENAAVVAKATNARDMQPYAPCHVAAASTGGGSPNIALTWVRRTRLHGDWIDSIGEVPLAETSEAYEVDILSAPGGSVKRTLSGLSSPAATYANANILTDFGSVPSSLTLKVFQMSGVVGRGLSREITIGVS